MPQQEQQLQQEQQSQQAFVVASVGVDGFGLVIEKSPEILMFVYMFR
ncbi:MAG TPA: hypothetical protein PK299_01315 [Anaerolineales bacterium]|nr:hypothetical protein [Anaerolineales bacterium]